jgi:hypothetical protein
MLSNMQPELTHLESIFVNASYTEVPYESTNNLYECFTSSVVTNFAGSFDFPTRYVSRS